MFSTTVQAGAVGLLMIQASQAFIVPSTFTFPGTNKASSVKTDKDVVNTLPIPKEDSFERLKNLQLGVSKPWPFPISSDDAQDARAKMRGYLKSMCKQLKGDVSKLAGKASDLSHDISKDVEAQELEEKLRQWWEATIASTEDLKSTLENKVPSVDEFKHALEDKLESTEEFKDTVEDKLPTAEELEKAMKHQLHSAEKSAEKFKDTIEEKFDFSGDDSSDALYFVEDVEADDVYDFIDAYDYIGSFGDDDNYGGWHVVGDDQDEDDENELVLNIYWIDADGNEHVEHEYLRFYPAEEDSLSDMEEESSLFPIPLKGGPAKYMNKPHKPHFDSFSPVSPHVRGKARCMASKFRRFMHSMASALRTFITGFLIPVLVGVAAGMTASLLGMLVGTMLGWVWVKLFRGGRRAEQVSFRDGEIDEKETLLAVDAESEGGEAPPLYVEKE